MPTRRKSRQPSADPQTASAECGLAAPIGPAVIELLTLAYRANVPPLLVGPRGVGKSEITATSARQIGIDCIARDLSLMEPPDLVGLPRIDAAATTFVPPEFLPRKTGRGGFLLIEEINRAPRYMQACCLELLTSRKLNAYRLPDGWLPVACINPKADGYYVDLLDAALMSRFMRIQVRASHDAWLSWARQNDIHPGIIAYVDGLPDALDEGQGGSNPRSWTYASRALAAFDNAQCEWSQDTLTRAIEGLVGPAHTTALIRLIRGTEMALKPQDVVHNWPACQPIISRWKSQGRLDLLAASLRAVLAWVRPDGVAQQLQEALDQTTALQHFFQELPGDLREQARACLIECGHTFLLWPEPADSAPVASLRQKARRRSATRKGAAK